MKINCVRALVIALAFVGFSASTVAAKSAHVAKAPNAIPVPLCNPGNPACMDDGSGN
jgi:hypothetical protein